MPKVVIIKTLGGAHPERTTKAVALAAFKYLRASGGSAKKLPSMLQQAGKDIIEAWQEAAIAQK